MKNKIKKMDIIILCIIVMLIIITTVGVSSFKTDRSYIFTNQYGDDVEMFGNGIYANDSYFKAPIFIGTDLVMLLIVVPMLIIALIKDIKGRTVKSKLLLISIIGTVLYYATSISFGVTYNVLHLLYILLFSTSLFSLFKLIMEIDFNELRRKQKLDLPSKGIKAFLIVSGIALIVAWLPDIIPTIISNSSLPLIEVYTTEITYILDMGVISPLLFICLYYLKNKDGLGDVILAIMLKLCVIIGLILPMQTVFQLIAGIEIPIPALITKVSIFILLSIFASFFNYKFYKNIDSI